MKTLRHSLFILLILVVALYATLHTTFFQTFMLNKIKSYLETHHNVSFIINGVDPLLPFSLDVQSLQLINKKENTDILKIDGLKIRLETSALLSGKILFRYIKIDKAHLYEIPSTGNSSPSLSFEEITNLVLKNHWGNIFTINSFTLAPEIADIHEPLGVAIKSTPIQKNLFVKGSTSEKEYVTLDAAGSHRDLHLNWRLNIPTTLGLKTKRPTQLQDHELTSSAQVTLTSSRGRWLLNGSVAAKASTPTEEYEINVISKTKDGTNAIIISTKTQTTETTLSSSATANLEVHADKDNFIVLKDAIIESSAFPQKLHATLTLSQKLEGSGSIIMKDENTTYININAHLSSDKVDITGCLFPLETFPEIIRSEFKDTIQIKGSYHYHENKGSFVLESPNNHYLTLTLNREKGLVLNGEYHSKNLHLLKKGTFTLQSDDLKTFQTKGLLDIAGANKIGWDALLTSQTIESGKINVSLTDLTEPSVILNMPTVGNIAGTVSLKKVNLADYKGDCDIHLESKYFRSPFFKMEETSLTGKIVGGKGQLTFQTKDLKNKSIYIDGGKVNFLLNQGKIHFDAEAESYKRGFLNSRLKFKSSGDVDLFSHDFSLTTFDLLHQSVRVILQNPLHLKRGHCQKNTVITVDKGTITIDGLCIGSTTQDWSGKIRVTDVPLRLLHMIVPTLVLNGKLNGHIALSGRQHPEINGELVGEKIIWSHLHEDLESIKKRSFEIRLKGKYSYEVLEWTISCAGEDQIDLKILGHINANNGVIDEKSALHCTTTGWVNLALISAILSSGDRLSGRLNLDLKAVGNITHPGINGQISMNPGYIELAEFGTVINDVNVSTTVRNSIFTIQHCSATDRTLFQNKEGIYGQLSVSGTINLQDTQMPKTDLVLKLKHFTIANSDSVQGKGDADLIIRSNTYNPDIKGDVHLDKVVINIEELVTEDDIPSIKIKDPRQRRFAKERKNEILGKKDVVIPLHLRLIAPEKFFLTGQGLDCEWQGEMLVNGPIDEPYLVGKITAKRGKFDFFGRAMKVDFGEVIFTKDDINEPKLKIVSTREFERGTITLTINNTAEKLLQFDSSPAMPEEEIISQLLFSKEAGRISAGQSIQLAGAVAKINGQKGLNFMEKLRNNLGLDSFEFREQHYYQSGSDDPTTSQALSIGKEIVSGVKVSVEQGTGQGSSRVSVEAEVAPNLSVEADVSGYQGSGVGFNWIKRY